MAYFTPECGGDVLYVTLQALLIKPSFESRNYRDIVNID